MGALEDTVPDERVAIMVDGVSCHTCPGCREVKPLGDFSKSKNRPLGIGVYCLKCKRLRDNKSYARRNPKRGPRSDFGKSTRMHKVVDGTIHWRCSRCREYKPASGFHRQPDKASGLRSQCRACRQGKPEETIGTQRECVIVSGVNHFLCPDCSEIKPKGAFPRNKTAHFGIHTYCKECFRARERLRLRDPGYRARKRAADLQYKAEHYQERVEHNKRYKERFPGTHRLYQRNAYRRNIERNRERTRDARDDKKREREREYRLLNKDKIRARQRVSYLVRSGQLERGERCEICRARGEQNLMGNGIVAHLDSYEIDRIPRAVVWLCTFCSAQFRADEGRKKKGHAPWGPTPRDNRSE
jgi:hypothetical protein